MVRVGIGCVNLGSASSRSTVAEQRRLVHAALDAGVTTFDTADAYGAGMSERVLGQALAGRRSRAVIGTKAGYVFDPRSPLEHHVRRTVAMVARSARRRRPRATPSAAPAGSQPYAQQDFSVAYLRGALEASLRRLATDHIDVFQLHGPPSHLPDLLAELDDLRVEGKVGRFGVGTESDRSAAEWIGDERVGVVQFAFGVLDPGTLDGVTQSASVDAVELWARAVLGGGVLATAMRSLTEIEHHPKAHVIGQLSSIAAEAGMGVDELAIRWALGRDELGVVLIGMTTVAHLMHNVAIAERGPLPPDLSDAIDSLSPADVELPCDDRRT